LQVVAKDGNNQDKILIRFIEKDFCAFFDTSCDLLESMAKCRHWALIIVKSYVVVMVGYISQLKIGHTYRRKQEGSKKLLQYKVTKMNNKSTILMINFSNKFKNLLEFSIPTLLHRPPVGNKHPSTTLT